MAKIDITTKTARARLKAQNSIYWRSLKPGALSLGYAKRKAAQPGTWVMRAYLGTDARGIGRHQKANLALADDMAPADGAEVLSFAQAQQLALDRHAQRTKAGTSRKRVGPLSVQDVMDSYVAHLKANGQSGHAAEQRIRAHITPMLGSKKVESLSTDLLTRWRDALAAEPMRVRTPMGKPQRFGKAPATPDEHRARRATVNRTVTILKAALNVSFRAGKLHDDLAWRRLAPFGKTDARRPGHLSVAESQRLINACDAEFRPLAIGALATGARYAELTRLRVGDFKNGKLAIHESKTGLPRSVRLNQEGRAFFAGLTVGRAGTELMFPRADGQPWGPNHQARKMISACERANIVPAIGFHQLRHTYASLLIMNSTPLLVVATNLGHRDTRMVEHHYGHLTVDYQDAAIEAGAPNFGIDVDSNVVPMKKEA